MRSAMIMSPDRDGIFDTLLKLVRFGLGGTAASGRQYISWMHDLDFMRSVYWLIEHEELSGPINLSFTESASKQRIHAHTSRGCGRTVWAAGIRVAVRQSARF